MGADGKRQASPSVPAGGGRENGGNGARRGGPGGGPGGEGADRDPFTAQHWNGNATVIVHQPSGRAGGPGAVAAELFGRPLPPQHWAALVGAPDGATVQVTVIPVGKGAAVQVATDHEWYDGPQIRVLYRDSAGRVALKNERFDVSGTAPAGVGTRALAHQARAAARLGVAYLATDAAGAPGSREVGYLVWARLGFNGPLPRRVRPKLAALPVGHALRDAEDVFDLITRPGGLAWWTANGSEFTGIFDLTPGSPSWRLLQAYTSSRGIRW